MITVITCGDYRIAYDKDRYTTMTHIPTNKVRTFEPCFRQTIVNLVADHDLSCLASLFDLPDLARETLVAGLDADGFLRRPVHAG